LLFSENPIGIQACTLKGWAGYFSYGTRCTISPAAQLFIECARNVAKQLAEP
jgi:hypothetical protein